MAQTKMTPTVKRHYRDLLQVAMDIHLDFQHPELVPGLMPPEWREVPTDPIPEKTRVTIRLDRDVAKFFRSFGNGYQTRMNLVLRMFMLAYLTDTLGRVPDQLDAVDRAAKDDDAATDLSLEMMHVRALKELRERRARGVETPRRRKGD